MKWNETILFFLLLSSTITTTISSTISSTITIDLIDNRRKLGQVHDRKNYWRFVFQRLVYYSALPQPISLRERETRFLGGSNSSEFLQSSRRPWCRCYRDELNGSQYQTCHSSRITRVHIDCLKINLNYTIIRWFMQRIIYMMRLKIIQSV